MPPRDESKNVVFHRLPARKPVGSTVQRGVLLSALTILVVVIPVVAVSLAAQSVAPLARFRSIEIQDGAHVILLHGPAQTVRLVKGEACNQFSVNSTGMLIIDKNAAGCPRKYDLEVEITTPDVAEVSVANGGFIESRDSFPRQSEIDARVRNGGTIDIRAIVVDKISASVDQGGRILLKPQTILSANVANGGQITYWGDARIQQSVQHGGAITKGAAADEQKPLSEFSPF
jgi:hypothetical protein